MKLLQGMALDSAVTERIGLVILTFSIIGGTPYPCLHTFLYGVVYRKGCFRDAAFCFFSSLPRVPAFRMVGNGMTVFLGFTVIKTMLGNIGGRVPMGSFITGRIPTETGTALNLTLKSGLRSMQSALVV